MNALRNIYVRGEMQSVLFLFMECQYDLVSANGPLTDGVDITDFVRISIMKMSKVIARF